MKIANWQLATLVFYKMISLDSDPALLLGLTDVTCGLCHACVSLNVTPMVLVLLYHIVLNCIHLRPMENLFFQHV